MHCTLVMICRACVWLYECKLLLLSKPKAHTPLRPHSTTTDMNVCACAYRGTHSCDDGRYQKAYVECFCSAQNLAMLMKAVADDRHGAMTYIASDVRGNMYVLQALCVRSLVGWFVRSLIHSTISRIHSFIHSVCIRSSLNFARYTNSKFRGPNAVTWGVFVNEEVLQPTVVDHEAFMVWKDEAFALWSTEWGALYEAGSPSAALIDSIASTYTLVAIVDNDFTSGDLWTGLFGEL